MKKLLFAVLFFTCSLSFSQTSFGFKGGILISGIETKENYYVFDDNRTSFYFGGFVEYKPTSLALNGSLEYLNTGVKGDRRVSFDDPYNYKTNLSINQINLSITGKYYITDKLSVGIGGYAGYILGGEMKDEYTTNNNTETYKNSYDKYLSDIDFGLIGGVEFEIYKGLFIEVRYFLGLKDIIKGADYLDTINNQVVKGEYIDSKNRIILIGLGYKF